MGLPAPQGGHGALCRTRLSHAEGRGLAFHERRAAREAAVQACVRSEHGRRRGKGTRQIHLRGPQRTAPCLRGWPFREGSFDDPIVGQGLEARQSCHGGCFRFSISGEAFGPLRRHREERIRFAQHGLLSGRRIHPRARRRRRARADPTALYLDSQRDRSHYASAQFDYRGETKPVDCHRKLRPHGGCVLFHKRCHGIGRWRRCGC